MSNFEDEQANHGWRPVFNNIPYTKNMAHKTVLPLGFFYSPFLGEVTQYKSSPALCQKCQASINPFSNKNRQARKWQCNFCTYDNALLSEIGQARVQQYVQGKQGDNGIFFIVDLAMEPKQLESVKQTMIKTVKKLPQNIFVGLAAFNRNLMICDFSGKEEPSFICINGSHDYSDKNFAKLNESLDLVSHVDPRQKTKVILNKFYVPIAHNQELLIKTIESLQADSFHQPRQLRQKRATGCALQVSISLISSCGINTRFVSIISGPCTIGPGKVVDLPLKKNIRVYMDIFEGTQNAQHVKPATKFYEGLQKILIENKNTLDIWAYGLDQFGLVEMKESVNRTGGILAMHQLFDHFIFQTSFQRFYEANEQGMFKFAIAAHMNVKLSKEMRINGMIGLGKSLKDNTAKTAAEMEIGQGGTNLWYLGGVLDTSCYCLFVSHSQANTSQNKQRGLFIQSIVRYKYSDNISRVRVSTIFRQYLRMPQLKQVIKGFDQEAATVMLARLATKKSEIEDVTEVKKWLDRLLLKFSVCFASFQRHDRMSFNIPQPMKSFPQFMYHLRRSGFINPFGSPPDQSIYMKTCMQRQSIPNCLTMIQPLLLEYSTESLQPTPVELDLQALKDDVILLLDTYFNVLVWYGDHIKGWKDDKVNEDPQFEYLNDLFEVPLKDAGQIMYDRIPASNFYETWKNDGKERYLKSRVNPSMVEGQSDGGHFVTDDAPIKVFMDFLIKSVINYNE